MTSRLKTVLLCVTFVAAAGCRQGRTLIVKQAELLEKPYPLNYPSNAPKPNRKLADLVDTRVCVLDDTYSKEFHIFKVRTGDGQEGYILDDPGVKETQAPCP